MKLRNKKTGEIVEPRKIGFEIYSFNERNYNSLAQFNEDWEDYEEPIVYWAINPLNEKQTVVNANGRFKYYSDEDIAKLEEVGFLYKTEDEAKKALEKLKAWKRLKDKGLTFCGWKITGDGCSVDIETTLDAEVVRAKQKYITDDLNLIFGEEE